MMDLDQFIKNFTNQFEETDASEFTAETNFKELDEWSSLIALMVIAMIDEEYNVKIKGDDMRKSATIHDLFVEVKSKL